MFIRSLGFMQQPMPMIVDDDDELLLRGWPGPKPPHQSRQKANRISKLSKGKLHDKMAKAVVAMVGVKLGLL